MERRRLAGTRPASHHQHRAGHPLDRDVKPNRRPGAAEGPQVGHMPRVGAIPDLEIERLAE